MTGMKEGAGEDPFAESDPDDPGGSGQTSTDESSAAEGAVGPDGSGSVANRGGTDSASGVSATEGGDDSAGTERDESSRRSIQIPYKFRRDSVQEGRERVPLFLMEETKSAEREALRELEERFGDDVSLTDLREAVVSVGLGRLDEVEDRLAEWGYGVTFEE